MAAVAVMGFVVIGEEADKVHWRRESTRRGEWQSEQPREVGFAEAAAMAAMFAGSASTLMIAPQEKALARLF